MAACYILGALLGSSFIMQFIFIGIIGGAGLGLVYVVPIAVCIKWFPDMKGYIIGPMLGGFVRDHIGSFLWAFIPAGIV